MRSGNAFISVAPFRDLRLGRDSSLVERSLLCWNRSSPDHWHAVNRQSQGPLSTGTEEPKIGQVPGSNPVHVTREASSEKSRRAHKKGH